ncbi:MAG TPA: sigma-70 family RNA polymerase sigma factor [Actinomycetota bacterium]|nr:sigma-70 family RNA polymerase sigma factor [Actinomycetota bacterium]
MILGRADADLLERIRKGDERAFEEVVHAYGAGLQRVAHFYAGEAAADEIVQETWVTFLKTLDRFEGRSSLRTWLYGIATNIARRRRSSDARVIVHDEPAVDPDRFWDDSGPQPGHWKRFPVSWDHIPEQRLLGEEIRGVVEEAISALPERQRDVIVLRDVEGLGADEVRDVLDLTKGNERVLLHRARSKVRRAVEIYLEDQDADA